MFELAPVRGLFLANKKDRPQPLFEINGRVWSKSQQMSSLVTELQWDGDLKCWRYKLQDYPRRSFVESDLEVI